MEVGQFRGGLASIEDYPEPFLTVLVRVVEKRRPMQLENSRASEGRRVRLNDWVRNRLLAIFEDDTRKPLTFGRMGLRPAPRGD